MSGPRSVIICGSGIIGLCAARELADAGFRVTVIERNAAGAGACTEGSAGYVSPSHVAPLAAPGMVWKGLKWMLSSRSPFYIRPRLDADLLRWGWRFARACTPEHTRRAAPVLRDLCLASREIFAGWSAAERTACEWRTDGLLNLCATAAGLEHETHGLAALANELGIEARVLDARATAALVPGVRLAIAGAVFFPIDAHVSPHRLLPVLQARAEAAGVEFRWGTRVTGWRAGAGGRLAAVRTEAGEFAADEFVLAGGSWSQELVAGLEVRLPLQAGKGYSLTLTQPRVLPARPLILTERRVAVTPMGAHLRFGGTMEISGHDGRVRPERIAQIIAGAQAFLPDFTAEDFAGIEPWFGYRPVSPDGLPYLGRFARHPNLTAACGHAMLGVTLAPITGRLVAEVLAGRKPAVDLTLLRPDRFA